MRILVVEDNADLAASVCDFLIIKGNAVDLAFDGLSALKLACDNEYDVFVFDISLPGKTGLELCQQLRQQHDITVPVLFLTARSTLEDKLAGFAAGADDYLVKPFDLEELWVRLQTIHKRTFSKERIIQIDDLSINLDTHKVSRRDQEISLAPLSYKLLAELAKRSPRLVTRTEIEHILWRDDVPDSDALRTQMYKLRNKIDKSFDRPLIHTVKGQGFKIE